MSLIINTINVSSLMQSFKIKKNSNNYSSVYNALEPNNFGSFPIRGVCLSWVQPRVRFFVWEATWGKVLTLDQVQKWGWSLANRCYLCLTCEEFIDHLLLHCEKIRVLWELFFVFFGVSLVLYLSVRDTLLGWHRFFVGKKCKKVWWASLLCLF